MKLKLLIIITVLAVIGIVVIAVVKKSNSVPEKPEITEVTTDVQVEMKPEIDLNSLGGKDENHSLQIDKRSQKEVFDLSTPEGRAKDKAKFKAGTDSLNRIFGCRWEQSGYRCTADSEI